MTPTVDWEKRERLGLWIIRGVMMVAIVFGSYLLGYGSGRKAKMPEPPFEKGRFEVQFKGEKIIELDTATGALKIIDLSPPAPEEKIILPPTVCDQPCPNAPKQF